jgi:hypothetical protein
MLSSTQKSELKYLSASTRTLGASFAKRENKLCFPVLAIQSYWKVEGTVTVAANMAAKSRIAPEAFGLPIVLDEMTEDT